MGIEGWAMDANRSGGVIDEKMSGGGHEKSSGRAMDEKRSVGAMRRELVGP